jgi:FK506-binding protein 2
VHQEGRERL